MDLSQLGSNPFFSGGLLLMILGGAAMYLRTLPGKIYDFFERFFIVKIEILDEDEAYSWMQVWLSEKLKDTLSISVITKRTNIISPDPEESNFTNKPQIYFIPAVGTYFFWYKRRFVTLHRDRKENATSSAPLLASSDNKSMIRTKESFTLRIFSRNKNLARELLEECRHMALPDDGKLDIRVATYSYWSLGTRIKPRPLNSVILDGNQAGELLADMNGFLESQEWYESVGVPYRRNYLLYGEPGNGKTSVVKALAGELGMHIYLLMLSDPDMNDNRINDLLAKVAERNILLLEDVDCAFSGLEDEDKRKKKSDKSGLTFSGLLNAMDGVASPEGRIIFMTTNHLERLDPALIRPGRADVKLYFGNATSDQAARLYTRFFPKHEVLAPKFGGMIENRKYSMATLQDYLMLHRQNPERALEMIGEIGKLQVNSVMPRIKLQPREPEVIMGEPVFSNSQLPTILPAKVGF